MHVLLVIVISVFSNSVESLNCFIEIYNTYFIQLSVLILYHKANTTSIGNFTAWFEKKGRNTHYSFFPGQYNITLYQASWISPEWNRQSRGIVKKYKISTLELIKFIVMFITSFLLYIFEKDVLTGVCSPTMVGIHI